MRLMKALCCAAALMRDARAGRACGRVEQEDDSDFQRSGAGAGCDAARRHATCSSLPTSRATVTSSRSSTRTRRRSTRRCSRFPNQRLEPERQAGGAVLRTRRPASPQAMKVWFYPGETIGNEFVYPKTQAMRSRRRRIRRCSPRTTSSNDRYDRGEIMSSMKSAAVGRCRRERRLAVRDDKRSPYRATRRRGSRAAPTGDPDGPAPSGQADRAPRRGRRPRRKQSAAHGEQPGALRTAERARAGRRLRDASASAAATARDSSRTSRRSIERQAGSVAASTFVVRAIPACPARPAASRSSRNSQEPFRSGSAELVVLPVVVTDKQDRYVVRPPTANSSSSSTTAGGSRSSSSATKTRPSPSAWSSTPAAACGRSSAKWSRRRSRSRDRATRTTSCSRSVSTTTCAIRVRERGMLLAGDLRALESALRTLVPEGRTALYDAPDPRTGSSRRGNAPAQDAGR